jgi:diguanylate cyclase (GGDEF)-like protein
MTNTTSTVRDKIARLRASFLEQLPARIEAAYALLARLQANPNDRAAATDLHRFLHSIKGTGRSFGLKELGVAAAEGEDIACRLLDGPGDEWPASWPELLAVCIDGIARALTDMQHGEVLAELETPGFVMPPRDAAESAHGQQRLVYLCDDEAAQVEQLAVQLACFGFDTAIFTDTESLRQAMRERVPDATIMDINFPQNPNAGTEVMAQIKEGLGQSMSALFLSSRDDFDARLQAVQAGGDAYFHKPARALELVAALDDLTQKKTQEPFRILVVDDEIEIAGYHSLILQEAGMITHQATEPEKVLGLLREFRPDMVLMDMYMPTCTGRDLAKMIRQVPEYVGLPIVYLSSETDKKKQFSAMRIGAEGFLTKPVVPDELVAAVAIRAERMRALRSLMARDSLTGLFNHTTTTQLLENAIAGARRQGGVMSFAMIDIDRFKSVNDTYGHSVGDQVILALARVLQQRLRNSDVVGRYGGEEFAVILPGVMAEQAAKFLDQIRDDFSRVLFHGGEFEFSCSISIGVASFPQHMRLELLREAADKALYEAKRSGRNRVIAD